MTERDAATFAYSRYLYEYIHASRKRHIMLRVLDDVDTVVTLSTIAQKLTDHQYFGEEINAGGIRHANLLDPFINAGLLYRVPKVDHKSQSLLVPASMMIDYARDPYNPPKDEDVTSAIEYLANHIDFGTVGPRLNGTEESGNAQLYARIAGHADITSPKIQLDIDHNYNPDWPKSKKGLKIEGELTAKNIQLHENSTKKDIDGEVRSFLLGNTKYCFSQRKPDASLAEFADRADVTVEIDPQSNQIWFEFDLPPEVRI